MKALPEAFARDLGSDSDETPRLVPQTFQTYAQAVEYFRRTPAPESQHPRIPYCFGPGLTAIHDSISAVAIGESRSEQGPVLEWNPLSQRPVFYHPPSERDGLEQGFMRVSEQLWRFISISHEAMHVALWEPFFTGHWRPQSKSEFLSFSLKNEGACFFYSDIVVASSVRERFPDGEFVFNRGFQSSPNFHPYRAFRALGITDPARILDEYLAAFAGEPCRLSSAAREPNGFAASLAGKIRAFYNGTSKPNALLHQMLSSTGILGEYHARFCSVRGLPSLFEAETQALCAAGDFDSFIRTVFEAELGKLDRCDPSLLTRVRLRRAIQTRAYFASQLGYILSNGLHLGKAPAHALKAIGDGVASYLIRLESILRQLARDPNERKQHQELEAADRYFETRCRRPLEKAELWCAKRYWIFPEDVALSVGVSGNGARPVDRDQARRNILFLVRQLSRRITAGMSTTEQERLLKVIGSLSSCSESWARGKRKFLSKAETERLARALGSADARPLWSLPLSAVDPLNNRFRELLFVYR
ncbi:MAG TPA: hypothetical protein VM598_08145 [Bdellovibrionota bacterium]|nr:hypothetical protein [Bdellovibrionota bacterium]